MVLLQAKKAYEAALKLAEVSSKDKDRALKAIAAAISKNKNAILKANARDVKAAEKKKIPQALIQRLKLNDSKIQEMVRMVGSVAAMDDPVGVTLSTVELDKGLELYKVSCPIGVIGVVFESRPDALVQISSLCLKSSNAVILKGGKEARESNKTLFNIVAKAAGTAGIPNGWIQLIEAREQVMKLLKLDEYVDLVIPRGSNEFVKYVQENTRIPVLGHADGVCHVYVDAKADISKALNISFGAKVQYPAVCNAVETLLVNEKISKKFLPKIADKYSEAGVEMRVCRRAAKILNGYNVKSATEKDWKTEYLDKIISIKVVPDVKDAIKHINTYGSKHTDAIITEDNKTAVKFMRGVDSSSVMWNASTRFSDGYRYGLGAEVGISTNKLHARGPTGLDGLVSYRYYLIGNGQVVGDYVGPKAKKFKHTKISKQWKG